MPRKQLSIFNYEIKKTYRVKTKFTEWQKMGGGVAARHTPRGKSVPNWNFKYKRYFTYWSDKGFSFVKELAAPSAKAPEEPQAKEKGNEEKKLWRTLFSAQFLLCFYLIFTKV